MGAQVTHHKPKVCMVTGSYFPEISGGAIQCRSLINTLKTQIDFFVIATTAERHSLDSGRLIYKDTVDGITVYRIAIYKDKSLFKINSALQAILFFLKHRKSFEILHLHGFTQKRILFILLAKLFRKKILTKITLSGIDDPYTIKKDSKFGRIKYYFYSLSDLLISPSPYLTELALLAGHPLNGLIEIPNGVDVDLFCPCVDASEREALHKELNFPLGKKIILSVGYFSKRKGIDLVVGAWKRIRDKRDNNVLIVFIGSKNTQYWGVDGALINWLNQQLKLYGMEKEFILIEKTHCIEKYYKIADVFILASRQEGLPNALLEAMACGLPCIVTKLKGITDVLINDGQNGLIIEQDDNGALARGLDNLLTNEKYALELGRNAREKIIKKYSIRDISLRYRELYGSLLKVPQ